MECDPRAGERNVQLIGSAQARRADEAGRSRADILQLFDREGIPENMQALKTFCSSSVHPHARGEHGPDRHLVHPRRGSSPRAWGTRPCSCRREVHNRFIPTRVGNTTPAIGFLAAASGSSPRAWGTLIIQHRPQRISRFIPTRVGNTRGTFRRRAADPVHPHARGEHEDKLLTPAERAGSSPRAWGTHDRPLRVHPGRRFIPTRVGNTLPRKIR